MAHPDRSRSLPSGHNTLQVVAAVVALLLVVAALE
jgi:hypothetical protein